MPPRYQPRSKRARAASSPLCDAGARTRVQVATPPPTVKDVTDLTPVHVARLEGFFERDWMLRAVSREDRREYLRGIPPAVLRAWWSKRQAQARRETKTGCKEPSASSAVATFAHHTPSPSASPSPLSLSEPSAKDLPASRRPSSRKLRARSHEARPSPSSVRITLRVQSPRLPSPVSCPPELPALNVLLPITCASSSSTPPLSSADVRLEKEEIFAAMERLVQAFKHDSQASPADMDAMKKFAGSVKEELVSLRAIQIHIGTWNRYIGDDPRHPDLALDFRPSDSTFCFSTIFEKRQYRICLPISSISFIEVHLDYETDNAAMLFTCNSSPITFHWAIENTSTWVAADYDWTKDSQASACKTWCVLLTGADATRQALRQIAELEDRTREGGGEVFMSKVRRSYWDSTTTSPAELLRRLEEQEAYAANDELSRYLDVACAAQLAFNPHTSSPFAPLAPSPIRPFPPPSEFLPSPSPTPSIPEGLSISRATTANSSESQASIPTTEEMWMEMEPSALNARTSQWETEIDFDGFGASGTDEMDPYSVWLDSECKWHAMRGYIDLGELPSRRLDENDAPAQHLYQSL